MPPKRKGRDMPAKTSSESSSVRSSTPTGPSSPTKSTKSPKKNRTRATSSAKDVSAGSEAYQTAVGDSSMDSSVDEQPEEDVFGKPRPLPALPSDLTISAVTTSSSTNTTNGFLTARDSSAEQLSAVPSILSSAETIQDLDGRAENIVVAVRIRPAKRGCQDNIWTVASNAIKLSPSHPLIKARGSSSRSSEEAYTFHFDAIAGPSQTTYELYEEKVAPGVKSAMDGFNSTIFAYGQTGSGKTHTMMGTEGEPGVVHLAIQEVFASIEADTSCTWLLRISYLEIYNETLKDLLAPSGSSSAPLKIRERAKQGTSAVANSKGNTIIYVDPLHEEVVTQPSDVFDALDRGEANRHVGATDWNLRSSRSHCVFTLTIESAKKTGQASGSTKVSQLNLIDLAGSEKMSTGAGDASDRNTEGSHINKSLLALGNVIAKLSNPAQKGHIPYRDSKLTRLLQPSLGGNARVAIICTVSADPAQAAESVSTLKFARNAKNVVTKAERGHVVNDQSALIQKYKRELEALRSKLVTQNEAIATAEDKEELELAKAEQQRQLGQLNDERAKAEEEIAEMRQQRVQLSNDLSRLTNVLLSGKEAVESSDGKPHNEQTILAAAGPAGSAARQVYSRRISEIGLDLTTPRKQGLPAATSSRSISSKLDSLATPRVGSIEKEAELEANIERLQVSIRQKDDSLFRLQAEHKELHSRFDFLEQESSEQSGLVAELRTQAEAADATRRELEVAAQEKVSLLEALKEAQSLQDQLRTELAAAQVNLQSTTDEGAKVSEVLQERDDTIQSLREEISHLQTKLHEGKAELDKVNSKTAATARLLSSLSHSRDQAEARARESEEKAASTSERAECAEEALVLLQQSLIDSRLAWEKKEQQLLADLDESNSHTERLQESTDELRTEKTALEDKLDAMSTKLARCEQDLHMLREARKPALPTSRYGPSADDLSAKLDALTNSTSRSVSGTGSRLSAAHPSQESDKSAMMQLTISEQRSKIQELERALRDSQEGGVLSRPRPSTSLGHASTILQDEGITIDGKVRSEETSRLNQVIESQKVTISDLQEDLFQWRTRMASQRELIKRLQAEGIVGPLDLSPFNTPSASPVRPRALPRTPAESLQSRFSRLDVNSERSSRLSPSTPSREYFNSSSPSSSPSKKPDHGLGILSPARPRQNGTPQKNGPDTTPQSARRRTIEGDLARLQNTKPVEKQKTALMTPRAAAAKQQRVLSGMQQRIAAQRRLLEDESYVSASSESGTSSSSSYYS